LTGLRFIAAFQVLVFHGTAWERWPVWVGVRNIAGAGHIAVSLFFVLSGFILTYVHAGPGAPPMGTRDFYRHRFARIYPTYAFSLAVIAPLFIHHTLRTEGPAATIEQTLAVLLLVQGYFPMFALAWNAPAWSLSDEAFFYALFPFLAPRICRCSRGQAVAIGCVSYGVAMLLPAIYLVVAPDAPATPDKNLISFWHNALRFAPPARLPEFIVGIVAGRLFLDMPPEERDPARWTRGSFAALGVIVVTLAVGPMVPYPALHNGLLAPVFAVLILALASNAGPLAKWLSARPLVALGEASYALYLIHMPILILWMKGTYPIASRIPHGGAVANLLFFPLAIGASLLVHRYVERPMLPITRRLLRGERPARDAASRSDAAVR
jgi:peptidoglycan/LPS O-acetylase OafA/YrhL